MINNVGYPFDRKTSNKRLHEAVEADFKRAIGVDLKETFRHLHAESTLMIKYGSSTTKRGSEGRIINIASIESTLAISGDTGNARYSIANATLVAIKKHIVSEYDNKSIRDYARALGNNFFTKATSSSLTATKRKEAEMERSMIRRDDPKEVAELSASIASEDFAFATSNPMVIEGGLVAL